VREAPRTLIFIDCRFGSQRRFVLFIAWLTLLPAMGPLPQTSQRFAISHTLPENHRIVPRRGEH